MENLERNNKLYNSYLTSAYASHYETKDTTYYTYNSYMQQFMRYLYSYEGNPYLLDEDFLEDCVFIMERFINYCRDNKKNNSQTIKNKIVAISAFYKWCVKRNKIKFHPFADKLDRPIVRETDKRRNSYYLTWKDVFKVSVLMEVLPKTKIDKNGKISYSKDKKQFDLQSRLLWELFIESGFRITPIQNLKLSQLDLDRCVFTGIVHKGGKVKDLYFFDTAKKILIEFIEWRKENNINTDYLFCVKYEKEYHCMSQTAIRKRIRKIGKLLGIDDFYPHTIRKTVINNINNLTDIKTASEFAGHNSVTTTEKHYIQRQNAERERDKIRMAMLNQGLI